MYNIKLLNKISHAGLGEFDRSRYRIGEDVEKPDAILVRSADMHDMDIPDSVWAIARAGAGVNNIPIDRCSERGIVVFNTPGANANAVKEMVIAGLLLSSRKIVESIEWVKTLDGSGDKIPELVEKGKSSFVGPEIDGKKLGVIGLGAIGVQVANTAHSLGMEVLGYDPYISIDAAWGLSRAVKKATSLQTLYSECDYLTIHVPVTPETREMLSAESFAVMKRGMRILNFARADLVNIDDLESAINSGVVAKYVTDFPNGRNLNMPNTIVIPHLGASTPESENNCASMAARRIIAFLESGIIKNSINFPNMEEPKSCKVRLCLFHRNVPTMLSQISAFFANANINIEHLMNKSKKQYACTFIDVDQFVSDAIMDGLGKIDGMIAMRRIG